MELLVFDKIEKDFIVAINHGEIYTRTLSSLLYKYLINTRIYIDRGNNQAIYYFQIKEQNNPTPEELAWIIDKEKELNEIIIRLLTLLIYLEKENLVTFFDVEENKTPRMPFGQGVINEQVIEMHINDKAIINLLIKYDRKEIIPSPALKNLEKNKFRSWDEVKFKRKSFATNLAIFLSFIIGVGGILTTYFNGRSNKEYLQIISEQKDQQINKLISKVGNYNVIDYNKRINEISERIDTLSSLLEIKLKQKETVKNKADRRKKRGR